MALENWSGLVTSNHLYDALQRQQQIGATVSMAFQADTYRELDQFMKYGIVLGDHSEEFKWSIWSDKGLKNRVQWPS